MILELNGTKVTIVDKTLGYQGDNLVNTIQVTVDKDSTWNYKLDMYKGKSKCFDSVLMTRDGNICTVELTNEILSYGGRYVFQLRGYTDTQTYHSDIFESWVNASIEYQCDCKQTDCGCDCKLPTEFYQIENNVTEINNHPPYPGDNGKWMIWDAGKHEYVESTIEASGSGTLVVTFTGVFEEPDKWGYVNNVQANHTTKEIYQAVQDGKSVIGVAYSSDWRLYEVFTLSFFEPNRATFEQFTGAVYSHGNDDALWMNWMEIAGETTIDNPHNYWKARSRSVDFYDFQTKTNLTTSITSSSTDEEYPSAKATYDLVNSSKDVMVVEFTLNGNTYTSNYTLGEIQQALKDGKFVYGLEIRDSSNTNMVLQMITQAPNIIFGYMADYNGTIVSIMLKPASSETENKKWSVGESVDITPYVINLVNFDYADMISHIKSSQPCLLYLSGSLDGKDYVYYYYFTHYDENNGNCIFMRAVPDKYPTIEFVTIHSDGTYTQSFDALENVENKVDYLSSESTDIEYPSAKATYDYGQSIQSTSTTSINNKLDKTAVVDVTADATTGQAADAKSVWDMIGNVKDLIDGI